jgi:hypothetical protein
MEGTMKILRRLVYTSYLSPDEDDTCVPQIVRHARTNNARLDVTGLLIFDGIRFCQYLEGPADSVLPLLDKIRNDSRHLEVGVKELSETDASRLTEWPLGLATRGQATALDAIHRFDPRTGKSAVALLHSLLHSLGVENTAQ